jgi:hypothetical protein
MRDLCRREPLWRKIIRDEEKNDVDDEQTQPSGAGFSKNLFFQRQTWRSRSKIHNTKRIANAKQAKEVLATNSIYSQSIITA